MSDAKNPNANVLSDDERTELEALRAFVKYFEGLYGEGLEVANYHMNGELEPFDNFFDSAMQEYENAERQNGFSVNFTETQAQKLVDSMITDKELNLDEQEQPKTVKTNMGEMPIEDYREIMAQQHGFDSYDDMYNQGYRLGNGYDKEAPASESTKTDIDFTNTIDETAEIMTENNKVNAMLYLTDSQYKVIAERSGCLEKLGVAFEDMLHDDDTTMNVYVDIYPDGNVQMMLCTEGDTYGWNDYNVPLSDDEKQALIADTNRAALSRYSQTLEQLLAEAVEKDVRPSNYHNNNNFALLVNDEVVTTNLIELPPYYAAIDTNNFPEIKEFLEENHLAVPVNTQIPSGFCEYPIYVFNPDKLMEYNKEATLAYENEAGIDAETRKEILGVFSHFASQQKMLPVPTVEMTVSEYQSVHDDKAYAIKQYPNGMFYNQYAYNSATGDSFTQAGGFETFAEAEKTLYTHRPNINKVAERPDITQYSEYIMDVFTDKNNGFGFEMGRGGLKSVSSGESYTAPPYSAVLYGAETDMRIMGDYLKQHDIAVPTHNKIETEHGEYSLWVFNPEKLTEITPVAVKRYEQEAQVTPEQRQTAMQTYRYWSDGGRDERIKERLPEPKSRGGDGGKSDGDNSLSILAEPPADTTNAHKKHRGNDGWER